MYRFCEFDSAKVILSRFIWVQLHSYVLPVMQGYYQIATFRIPASSVAIDGADNDEKIIENGDPSKDLVVDYVIVSRRSRDRAGLRYQRRGLCFDLVY